MELRFDLNERVFLHFGKIKYNTNVASEISTAYDALLDTDASVVVVEIPSC